MKKKYGKTLTVCYLAIGIALYAALSMTLKIPLISHIQTDLGYIVFGAYCVCFGWQGAVVGAAGCLIESLIFSGWVPAGWIAGQIFIGLAVGACCRLTENKSRKVRIILRTAVTALAVFIGIAGIKTVIECKLYDIPIQIKAAKNSVAAAADLVPMLIGIMIGDVLVKRGTLKAIKQ